MDKQIREEIALKRHMIISPVLAEHRKAPNDYFRMQAHFEHDFAYSGVKESAISTMKSRSVIHCTISAFDFKNICRCPFV